MKTPTAWPHVLHHTEKENKFLRAAAYCLVGEISRQTNNYTAKVEHAEEEEHRGSDIVTKTGRANRSQPAQEAHGIMHTNHRQKGRLESKVNPVMRVFEHWAQGV